MRRFSATSMALVLLVLTLVGCSSAATAKDRSTHVATTPTATVQSTPEQQWIALASQSPSDVIAAAKKSTIFQESANGSDAIDVSHLGTPLLVLGLAAANTAKLPDFYDIPLLNASGAVIGAVACQLNADRTALYVGIIAQYGRPRSSGSVALITQQMALAEVAAKHNTTSQTGTQPKLIYFPFNQVAQDTGQINWRAGGDSPVDPIWEIDGADGKQHFAGADGNAYFMSELPLAPSVG